MPYQFARSEALFARSREKTAGGVNSGIRLMEKPVPLFFDHGKGSRVWDVDGNEYIDFQIGQGALLYGHAPPGMAEAIAEQARRGTHFAAQTELEIEVAELVCRLVPSAELIRCNNSATEVVAAAFRLARAWTQRPKILRFEGHYHGWMDEGLVGFGTPPQHWGPDDRPASWHPSGGIITSIPDQFVVARWNDPDHLETLVRQHHHELAAIVFEPILCNTGCIEPVPGQIKTIRRLCNEHGLLMIADECITGFRFGGGGAQEYLQFQPDLSIFGKAVGGGTPFAVLAGRATYMDAIISGKMIHAGTLNGNPLCLAASRWCLRHLEALGKTHPAVITSLGQRLMDGLETLARELDIPLQAQGPGAAFHTAILKPGVKRGRCIDHRDYTLRHDSARWAHLRRCLLEEGVRAIERGLWFISLAHTEKDIEEALPRARVAMERHQKEWKS